MRILFSGTKECRNRTRRVKVLACALKPLLACTQGANGRDVVPGIAWSAAMKFVREGDGAGAPREREMGQMR